MLPILMEIRDENDRNYVEEEIAKYEKRLFKVAYKYILRKDECEDCVHEVVIALVHNLQKYQTWDEEHQCKFLIKCCKNIAINKFHQDIRHPVDSITDEEGNYIDIIDESARPDRAYEQQEMYEELCGLISALKPAYRDVMYMKCVLEMTNKDIAEAIGLSVDLVNVRIHRAREVLSMKRGKYYND